MKKIYGLFLLLFVLAACSMNGDYGRGALILKAPSTLFSSVESSVPVGYEARYIVNIELNGKVYESVTLERNEKTSVGVPSDTPFNLGVGLYYVNPDNGTYFKSVYEATYFQEGLTLSQGEVREIEVVLDRSKSTSLIYRNDSEVGNNGMVSVTSGIYNEDMNSVLFTTAGSTRPLYYSAGLKRSLLETGEGVFIPVADGPNDNRLWFVDNDGIMVPSYAGNLITGLTVADTTLDNFDLLKEIASTIRSIKSIKNEDTGIVYYLFSYGTGKFAAVKFFEDFVDEEGSHGPQWSSFTEVDLSDMFSLYGYQSFILDADEFRNGEMFFLTKMGFYYIETTVLDYFIDDDRTNALLNLTKFINIQHPRNNNASLLATHTAVSGNRTYIGTRMGVYSINTSSSGWSSFIDFSKSDFMTLDNSMVRREAELFDEPISYMEIISTSTLGDLLVIATNNKMIVKSITTGKKAEFNVWNGFCFTTDIANINEVDFNPNDFRELGIAPVKTVVADDTNSILWIGTTSGILSVPYSDIF